MLGLHESIINTKSLVQQVLVGIPQSLERKHPCIQEVLPGPSYLECLAVSPEVGPILILHPFRHFFPADLHRSAIMGHPIGIMLVYKPFSFVQIKEGMGVADSQFEYLLLIQTRFQMGVQQGKGFLHKARRGEILPFRRAYTYKTLCRESLSRGKFDEGFVPWAEHSLRLISYRRFGYRTENDMLIPSVGSLLKGTRTYKGLGCIGSGKQGKARVSGLSQATRRNASSFVRENPGFPIICQAFRRFHITELIPVVIDAGDQVAFGTEKVPHPDFVFEAYGVSAGVLY